MHVMAENYEQIHTYTRDNHSTIIKIIRSAEALRIQCNIYTYAKPINVKYMHRSGIIIKRNALRVSKHVTEIMRNIVRGVGIN